MAESERSLYKLDTNDKLLEILSKFSTRSVNWEQVADFFKQRVVFETQGKVNLTNLIGTAAELHLRSFLEEIAINIPELNLLPIPYDTQKSNFVFKEGALGGGNYVVFHTGTRNMFVEYDMVISVSGLPVVFEVKTSEGAIRAQRPERINKLLLPLDTYFKNEAYGYVLVVPKGQDSKLSQYQNTDGVLMAPMFNTSPDFTAEVERNKDKFRVNWADVMKGISD